MYSVPDWQDFCLFYIFIFLSVGDIFGNVITPVHNEVYKTEKDIISLSCNYSSAASLYWHRQYPGSAPEFLLVILHANGKVLQKKEDNSVDLIISSAAVSDSALYYCALQPTVTGNTQHTIQEPETLLSCKFAVQSYM
uniref:T-cell receptor alpha/delta variable 25.0.1 n=1 Tax=Sinocyclocheilus rhinocerous TaxID=307959 RepID=A0A673L782_9TELE